MEILCQDNDKDSGVYNRVNNVKALNLLNGSRKFLPNLYFCPIEIVVRN